MASERVWSPAPALQLLNIRSDSAAHKAHCDEMPSILKTWWATIQDNHRLPPPLVLLPYFCISFLYISFLYIFSFTSSLNFSLIFYSFPGTENSSCRGQLPALCLFLRIHLDRTDIGQILDRYWADIGQILDRYWTDISGSEMDICSAISTSICRPVIVTPCSFSAASMCHGNNPWPSRGRIKITRPTQHQLVRLPTHSAARLRRTPGVGGGP